MAANFSPIELPERETLERCQPLVRSFYDYWERARRGKPMPSRSDIDPMAVPRHLPGIILIDVEGFAGRGHGIYRYRVVGTYEVDNRGHNPTGKLVDDGYFAADVDSALAAYDHVCTHKVGIYEELNFVTDRGIQMREQSIVLPLSENGDAVSQIIVYSERSET